MEQDKEPKKENKSHRFWIVFITFTLVLSAVAYATTITDSGTSQFTSDINISEIIIGDTPCADIRYYGAVAGDGLSDSLAIQTAINTTAQNNGGCVYFPRGQWDIDTTLNFYGGIRYLGSTEGYDGNGVNNGTILYLMDNSDTTMIKVAKNYDGGNNYFPVIEHLTLIGNSGNNADTSHGIEVRSGLFDLMLNDVLIFDFENYGLYIDAGKVWANNIYTEFNKKGIFIGDLTTYVYMNNVYNIFSYEDSFVIEGGRFVSISNAVIGYTRGSDSSLKITSTEGTFNFNNILFSGSNGADYNTSTIINLSNNGTSQVIISNSRLIEDSLADFGIWKSSGTTNDLYSILNIDIDETNITTKTNSVAYHTTDSSGSLFENQDVKINGQSYINQTADIDALVINAEGTSGGREAIDITNAAGGGIRVNQASGASSGEEVPTSAPTLRLRRSSSTLGSSIAIGNSNGNFYIGADNTFFKILNNTGDSILELNSNGLAGSFTGGSRYVCAYSNGTLYTDEIAC